MSGDHSKISSAPAMIEVDTVRPRAFTVEPEAVLGDLGEEIGIAP
jgi:hypothetical protein